MRYYLLTFCFMGMWQGIFAQNITISGTIEEDHSREKIIGANIWEVNSSSGTSTNAYGFYSLSLDPGARILIFSYVGYQPDTLVINLTRDTVINIHLQNAVQLNTLNVKADRVVRIEEESQMSRNEIPIEQLKKLPAFLGETDVLKTLQLLPGVQSGTEGSTGFYVRGGSIDQNLVLVDGVPIYNPTHVLGIFSSFNSDVIRNVSIIKGGFPARYGGRLSSVVEVNTKDGHMNEYHGAGQIGLISSKLMVEGPIIPNKSSFVISGRRTYIDVLLRPIVKASQQGSNDKTIPTAYFYDLNLKLNYRFNDKHRLIFSSYFGADRFGAINEYTETFEDKIRTSIYKARIQWGNIVSSLNWNHRWNTKLFANTTLSYTRYLLETIIDADEYSNPDELNLLRARYYSGIEDLGLKYNLDFIPNPNHSIKVGTNWIYHQYSPGAFAYKEKYEGEFSEKNSNTSPLGSVESMCYIEDDISYGSFKVNAGVHYSQFYTDNAFYHSLQPRLSIRYLLPSRWALKASFANMSQYINLLSNESLSLPTDLWVPSTKRVVPQRSWQIAIGGAKTIHKAYELSLEAYYKEMNNVLTYRPGVSFIVQSGTNWEDKIIQGSGSSYGFETMIQKKFGKTSGWIAYTLSWHNRSFEEINHGIRFPFKYDRRHDFSVVMTHQFNENWSFSGTWVYGTGNAISIPNSTFTVPGSGQRAIRNFDVLPLYTEKNTYRMGSYHRMDVSFQWEKEKKWATYLFTFGAYNVYYRKNPFFISYDRYKNKLAEVSILPILPYVSWGFKF